MTSFRRNSVLKKLGTYGGICHQHNTPTDISVAAHLAVVVGQTEEQQVGEQERHDGQRPYNVHDRAGRHVRVRVGAVERVAPVPQCRDPDLLQPLDDARSHDPDFRGSSGLFTKVETEEEESTGRRHSVAVRRDSGDCLSRAGENAVEGREPDKQEGNGEPARELRYRQGTMTTHMSQGSERT